MYAQGIKIKLWEFQYSLICAVSFARACLSLSKTDAADALERAWAAEKLAAAAIPQQGLISSFTSMLGGASDDQAENIEDKLVQADAFLIGW